MKTIGDSLPRRFKATASGALASGDTVIVKSDGTVSVITETSTVEGIGTEAIYETGGEVLNASTAFDVNSGKVVIAYSDSSDWYGMAIVGTVSGTSISFGTAVVFESATVEHITAVYDPDAQKVVIAYQDEGNSSRGTAIVGTVSGTSISFGSATVFETGNTQDTRMSYDTNADKVVIAYQDTSDSSYGKAVVGTVSGTSISFGTVTNFNSASTDFIDIAYDTNAQKHLIVYRDNGDGNDGNGNVATVSGTSISFGSEVEWHDTDPEYMALSYDPDQQKVVIAFNDGNAPNIASAYVATISGTSFSVGPKATFDGQIVNISATYHAAAKKTVIIYRDDGNSNRGTVVNGTVSGTSISFTTPFVFETGPIMGGIPQNNMVSYDPTAEKSVIVFSDGGDSNKGKAFVYSTAFSSTDLTSENYIGIAEYAASDTETATVLIKGGVSTTQSSLTPGQTYFVQGDGALGLTAGDPSVTAGTAVTSTKLIVKG